MSKTLPATRLAPRSWAIEQRGLSSPEKFVLLMIADYYDTTKNVARVSMRGLAQMTNLSLRTVMRCVSKLEKYDLIRRERWVREISNANATNRYFIPALESSRLRIIKELPPQREVVEIAKRTAPAVESGDN